MGANRGGFALDGCFAQMVGDTQMYEPQTENGCSLYVEMMPTVPAAPQKDNLHTLQIWKWGNFSWTELQSGLCEQDTAFSQFERGYQAAQEHLEELDNAIQWLLAASDTTPAATPSDRKPVTKRGFSSRRFSTVSDVSTTDGGETTEDETDYDSDATTESE